MYIIPDWLLMDKNNISLLGGFICANIVSFFFADRIINALYIRLFNKLTRGNKDLNGHQIEEQCLEWRDKLDLEFGKRIGRIERFFYIYSVMLNEYSLLSGWVILKAFYGWIQQPSVSRSNASEKDKEITTFYTYVYGNALSLISGLILGHVGLTASVYLSSLIK